jgi:hypothetical protein
VSVRSDVYKPGLSPQDEERPRVRAHSQIEFRSDAFRVAHEDSGHQDYRAFNWQVIQEVDRLR